MPDPRVLLLSLIGLGFGAVSFFNGFGWYRELRTIQQTPTSKVRSLAMGKVEIYGEIVGIPERIFQAPFSRKKCVWCRWAVEEYRRSGKHSRWVTIKTGVLGNYFYLRDTTGQVLVDTKGANVNLARDSELGSSFTRAQLSDASERFLGDQGISVRGILGFRRVMRFKEYFLSPGDNVYIYGSADDNPFVEDATAQRNEADIMIQKGKGKFFYISDKPEKEVIKSFKVKVFLGLLGGGALIIACLYILFAYLNIL